MKIKKILKSTFLIAVTAMLVVGATRAFFSDTETSVGNRFQAGAVDLKIDSTAHYNGMVCVLNEQTETVGDYWWQPEPNFVPGPTQYPVAGTLCTGSFAWADLNAEKFFDLADVKPGDMGENTISMHVYNNDAWACMDLTNLVEDENSQTEPELAVDLTPATGELAGNMYMFGWLEDDGDNVYQVEDRVLFQPTLASTLFNQKLAIADASTGGVPLPGTDTEVASKYVGLQWCVGTMSVVGNVITCNGSAIGNDVQTDKMTFDLGFYVEQARNNEGFLCNPVLTGTPTPTPTVLVTVTPTATPAPSATPIPSPSPTPQVLACEVENDVSLFSNGFEDNYSSWNQADNDWGISTSYFKSGLRSARIEDNDSQTDLIRKELSTSGYENLVLSFWHRTTDSNLGTNDDVYVEWYDGSSWNEIAHYVSTSVSSFTQQSFNLPSGAENNSAFQLRFRAVDLENGNTYRVDDVSITGDEICEN